MAVQLSQTDFRELVRIVSTLPNFAIAADRVRLVVGALEGAPRAADILTQITFDGNAYGVAVEVIRRLANFGRVTPDKEALGIFLNELLFYKGDADPDVAFLRGLFTNERYALDRPIAQKPPVVRWRGNDDNASVQEKIIGEDTLRHIRFLRIALAKAEAVVHITAAGYGTGFLIAPDLLMTNHHVLQTVEVAQKSTYTMYYELDLDDTVKATVAIAALKDGLFYTNPKLDYTVIQLERAVVNAQPLRLQPQQVQRDARVTIIQHPGGHFKKISMQNNFVVYADSEVVQYTTSTLPGSSGAPVFNDDFQVVAIHRAGGMLAEPGLEGSSQQRYLRNEGASMIAVLKDLGSNQPEIYGRLTF
jgi:hypothetical protein